MSKLVQFDIRVKHDGVKSKGIFTCQWESGELYDLVEKVRAYTVEMLNLSGTDNVRVFVRGIFDNELPEVAPPPTPSVVEVSQQVAALQARLREVGKELSETKDGDLQISLGNERRALVRWIEDLLLE